MRIMRKDRTYQRDKRSFYKRVMEEIPDVKDNSEMLACGEYQLLGVRSEVLLHALEEREIYVSAGSACSSNKPSQWYFEGHWSYKGIL